MSFISSNFGVGGDPPSSSNTAERNRQVIFLKSGNLLLSPESSILDNRYAAFLLSTGKFHLPMTDVDAEQVNAVRGLISSWIFENGVQFISENASLQQSQASHEDAVSASMRWMIVNAKVSKVRPFQKVKLRGTEETRDGASSPSMSPSSPSPSPPSMTLRSNGKGKSNGISSPNTTSSPSSSSMTMTLRSSSKRSGNSSTSSVRASGAKFDALQMSDRKAAAKTPSVAQLTTAFPLKSQKSTSKSSSSSSQRGTKRKAEHINNQDPPENDKDFLPVMTDAQAERILSFNPLFEDDEWDEHTLRLAEEADKGS